MRICRISEFDAKKRKKWYAITCTYNGFIVAVSLWPFMLPISVTIAMYILSYSDRDHFYGQCLWPLPPFLWILQSNLNKYDPWPFLWPYLWPSSSCQHDVSYNIVSNTKRKICIAASRPFMVLACYIIRKLSKCPLYIIHIIWVIMYIMRELCRC